MFKQFIFDILETLISTDVANVFTEPLALFSVLLLISMLLCIFTNSGTKRLILISLLVITIIFATFMIASQYGFIVLPVVLGG